MHREKDRARVYIVVRRRRNGRRQGRRDTGTGRVARL